MGKIGFESSKHVGCWETGGSSHQIHQGKNFGGRATFSIDNRVDHVGHVANHCDSDPVADDSLLSENWSRTVQYILASVEARRQL